VNICARLVYGLRMAKLAGQNVSAGETSPLPYVLWAIGVRRTIERRLEACAGGGEGPSVVVTSTASMFASCAVRQQYFAARTGTYIASSSCRLRQNNRTTIS
jgi:hypothetical protein